MKNTLFGYFWARILKNYCHIWNQHPQVCQFGKFCEKTMPKFGTKNTCEIFGLELKKKRSHIWSQHSRICLITKFRKKKCLNLGPKMLYLGIRTRIWKSYCHIRNMRPRISEKWVFNSYGDTHTHTHFGIGSPFPQGSGSGFSEGPRPRPGPGPSEKPDPKPSPYELKAHFFYKVCHFKGVYSMIDNPSWKTTFSLCLGE